MNCGEQARIHRLQTSIYGSLANECNIITYQLFNNIILSCLELAYYKDLYHMYTLNPIKLAHLPFSGPFAHRLVWLFWKSLRLFAVRNCTQQRTNDCSDKLANLKILKLQSPLSCVPSNRNLKQRHLQKLAAYLPG